MPKIDISSSDIERVLKGYGFRFVSQKGSHQQFKGFIKGRKRRVTLLADKRDFDIKTFKSIVRQSGLDEDELFK